MKIFRNKYIHAWVSITLFLTCLFFPAFYTTKGVEEAIAWDSLGVLIFGWLGIFIGIFYWYANIFYLFALLKIRDLNMSCSLGFAAFGLGLLFLTQEEILANEAGDMTSITGYGLGYIFWVSCFGVFWLGQSQLLVNKSKK